MARAFRARPKIEKMYPTRFEQSGFASSIKMDSKSAAVDGDFAYESGAAEIEALKEGKPSSHTGHYLTVWHRPADGCWKIFRKIVLPYDYVVSRRS